MSKNFKLKKKKNKNVLQSYGKVEYEIQKALKSDTRSPGPKLYL